MNEPSRKDRDEAISRLGAEIERLTEELEKTQLRLERILMSIESDSKDINHGRDEW